MEACVERTIEKPFEAVEAALGRGRAFVSRIAGVLERAAMPDEVPAGPPFPHGGE